MMHRILVAVITITVFNSAFAQSSETVSLAFEKVPVIQLLQATYRHMLGLNYIIDPAISADARAVTLNVKNLPKSQIKVTVDALLAESGIGIKEVGGIPYFFAQIKPSQNSGVPVAAQARPMESGDPVLTTVSTSNVSPRDPVQDSARLTDLVETKFLKPRYRTSDQLQKLANILLGTAFDPSDMVILAGDKSRVDRVELVIQQYDTAPSEITAKALIFEFQDNKSEGSTFQLAANVLAGKLNFGIGGAANPLANFIRFKNASLDSVLSAVSGDARFRLVSAPSIRVRDGSKGRIVVGSEVPVLAEAQLDKNGNPVQSIQYRSSGVIFEIAPRIMTERIELNLTQQLSNFQQTSTSNINSPTLTKREVSTVVGIESGDMVVLGGLDETKDQANRQGLSFLPHIFDSIRSDNSKSQVLVVLQVALTEKEAH